MLLCKAKKFIFIKTRKTAGTTVEILLSPYCDGSDDIVTPLVREDEALRYARSGITPKNFRFTVRDWIGLPAMISRQRRLLRQFDRRLFLQRFWNHVDGRIVEARVSPEQWRYLRFCVERDPWDKMVSCYYYLAEYLGRDPETWSFRDFFDEGWAEWLSDYTKYSAGGEFIVDRIINFDRLGEGLALLAPEIHVQEPLAEILTGIAAKKSAAGRKKPAVELFEADLERRGRHLFAREIEVFGFRRSPQGSKVPMDPYLFSNGRTAS
jgi:hypothetical protein